MSSGILLFGISLIYGFTGSINYFEIAGQLDVIDKNSVQFLGVIFGIIFMTASLCFKFGADTISHMGSRYLSRISNKYHNLY